MQPPPRRIGSPVLRHALLRAVVHRGSALLLAARALAELATRRDSALHAAVRAHPHAASIQRGSNTVRMRQQGRNLGEARQSPLLRQSLGALTAQAGGRAGLGASQPRPPCPGAGSLYGDDRALRHGHREGVIASQHVHLESSARMGQKDSLSHRFHRLGRGVATHGPRGAPAGSSRRCIAQGRMRCAPCAACTRCKALSCSAAPLPPSPQRPPAPPPPPPPPAPARQASRLRRPPAGRPALAACLVPSRAGRWRWGSRTQTALQGWWGQGCPRAGGGGASSPKTRGRPACARPCAAWWLSPPTSRTAKCPKATPAREWAK